MSLSPVIRRRLEIQGFACTDDPGFTSIVPWLRFTPALCTVLIGLGTVLASPAILWTLALIAALGSAFPTHPFDLVYNYVVRRAIRTPPLPPNGTPRRFACGLAAVWLATTALAFGAGAVVAGYLLGGAITVVGAIVSTTHFCIPSLIYRLLTQRRPATTSS
jgi:hypothetical protein